MAILTCMGELIVDFIPLDREKGLLNSSDFRPAPGGAPANVAAGFSKLGGRAAVISKVGRDPFGEFLIRRLNDANVDTSMIGATEKALTGLAFAFENETGENEFILYRNPSADMLISEKEIDPASIEKTQIFHFGSISLAAEPSRRATLLAARTAAENNKTVSFDPNLRPAAWTTPEQARGAILEGLQLATILKVSLSELMFIFPGSKGTPENRCRTLLENYPRLKLVAVTEAEKGSIICTGHRIVKAPPYPVKSVDATGAGDAYTAALLFMIYQRLLKNNEGIAEWNQPDRFWKELGRFANIAGALVTTRHGGIPAMPAYSEVIDAVKR